jgi:hypothetical protein
MGGKRYQDFSGVLKMIVVFLLVMETIVTNYHSPEPAFGA